MKHVAPRTLEPAQASLNRAMMTDSLERFTAGTSHVINNLMTCVLGYSELIMLKLPEDSPCVEYLRNIEQAAGQAADLCQRMATYAGKGRYVIVPHDINVLTGDFFLLLQSMFRDKADMYWRSTWDLPKVGLDATRYRQALMEVVLNAVEAGGARRNRIWISARMTHLDRAKLDSLIGGRGLCEGMYVAVEVRDTGTGMDAATKDRMFDPFFSTKSASQGMGLSMVQGIMRRMAGAVAVRSEPGKGTAVEMFFPPAPV
ncbi:sensor histidine kinase [Zavarzinella formosa]|uniref:sensor histidine kinase n=1 Tax=Zavarzinella formosa TaxID=360055 RepID=UPI0012FA9487|nr:ATP-binding protein [Zavarzinella formosa]